MGFYRVERLLQVSVSEYKEIIEIKAKCRLNKKLPKELLLPGRICTIVGEEDYVGTYTYDSCRPTLVIILYQLVTFYEDDILPFLP
jgi:hypothetical protein